MKFFAFFLFLAGSGALQAQMPDSVLTLRDAIQTGLANYAEVKTKQDLVRASGLEVQAAREDGLPDLTVGTEMAYGTLNGMNGLSSGQPGLVTLTSGPVTGTQNWNAAFGALYVTNVNWNLFSFGLQRAHVAAAAGVNRADQQDLAQEQFQVQVRIAGAYLSVLAAGGVRQAMEENLQRAMQLRDVILSRTENGLNPGVDSSIANAEVSKARLSLIDARNYEEGLNNQLCIQMGIPSRVLSLDTNFSASLPRGLVNEAAGGAASGGVSGAGAGAGGDVAAVAANPTLQYLASRVSAGDELATYLRKTGLPRVSLFGVGQERGSGFGGDFSANPADYSHNFFNGIQPERGNYLVGIGVAWDITDLGRSRSKANAQRFRSKALADEYTLEESKLTDQLVLSDQQIRNAIDKYDETPVQLKSARDAYMQKKALYESGLNNIVDVTQTLYLLNRAEIDQGIACNAVWQALLFKAGTAGDLNSFFQQF